MGIQDNVTAVKVYEVATGLMMIKAYHRSRNDFRRTKIIIPDSAHGTNPASAAMAGFQNIEVKSNVEGGIDLDSLKSLMNDEIAGLMLTNPNTLGLFDKNILEIELQAVYDTFEVKIENQIDGNMKRVIFISNKQTQLDTTLNFNKFTKFRHITY